MSSIYLVYTKDIFGISLVYTRYVLDVGIYLDILGIYLTWYIPGIYQCNKIRYRVVGAAGEDRAPFHPCRLRQHLQAL